MTFDRSQLLTDFRKRWAKDAQTDGDDLPISEQRENAYQEGADLVPKALRDFRHWITAKARSMQQVVEEALRREKEMEREKP